MVFFHYTQSRKWTFRELQTADSEISFKSKELVVVVGKKYVSVLCLD